MLSMLDVQRLMNEPQNGGKAELATAVASAYNGELRPAERELAEDIIRRMLKEIDVTVRQSLSEVLHANKTLPREIALAIANDVAEVATPMLHHSLIFSDKDLIEIIRNRPQPHQIAVAQRNKVSEPVSQALIDTGDTNVVTMLMGNEGAEISEQGYGKVIDFFSGQEVVMESVVSRATLPANIIDRLISVVSDNLRLAMALKHDLPLDIAETAILFARERATLELWPDRIEPSEVNDLVERLYDADRLTNTLMLRALCEGDFAFFTVALAKSASVPPEDAWQLMHDENETKLIPICRRAGFDKQMRDMTLFAVRLAKSIDTPNEIEARWHYRTDIVRKFRAIWPDLERGDVEGLLQYLFADGVGGKSPRQD
jgi:uncharacterized protein (DUF2336 family)